MCRYSTTRYKSHYACFKCRKSFKQANSYDIFLRVRKEITGISENKKTSRLFVKQNNRKLSELMDEIENRPVKCPECGNLMADLGLDFKAPKKTAVKEWKIVESLFKIGKSFHTCGCYGIGYIPQNPKDYEAYLKRILEEYENILVSYQNKTEIECTDKMERINYWSERISKIRSEIINQKFEIALF